MRVESRRSRCAALHLHHARQNMPRFSGLAGVASSANYREHTPVPRAPESTAVRAGLRLRQGQCRKCPDSQGWQGLQAVRFKRLSGVHSYSLCSRGDCSARRISPLTCCTALHLCQRMPKDLCPRLRKDAKRSVSTILRVARGQIRLEHTPVPRAPGSTAARAKSRRSRCAALRCQLSRFRGPLLQSSAAQSPEARCPRARRPRSPARALIFRARTPKKR